MDSDLISVNLEFQLGKQTPKWKGVKSMQHEENRAGRLEG